MPSGNGPPDPGKMGDKDFKRYVVASLADLHAKMNAMQEAIINMLPAKNRGVFSQQTELRSMYEQSLLRVKDLLKQIEDG